MHPIEKIWQLESLVLVSKTLFFEFLRSLFCLNVQVQRELLKNILNPKCSNLFIHVLFEYSNWKCVHSCFIWICLFMFYLKLGLGLVCFVYLFMFYLKKMFINLNGNKHKKDNTKKGGAHLKIHSYSFSTGSMTIQFLWS